MLKILLVSHGDFCSGLLNSYEMIAGVNQQISYVKLDESGIGGFSERLTNVVEELIEEHKVLILTDIKGGTPFNEAYKLFLKYPENIRVVAGMNLPMLVETGLNAAGMNQLDELMDLAIKTGTNSVEGIQIEETEEEELDF